MAFPESPFTMHAPHDAPVTGAALRPSPFGEIIDRAVEIVRRRPAYYLGLTALGYGPLVLAVYASWTFITEYKPQWQEPWYTAAAAGLAAVVTLVYVWTYVVRGSIVTSAYETALYGDASGSGIARHLLHAVRAAPSLVAFGVTQRWLAILVFPFYFIPAALVIGFAGFGNQGILLEARRGRHIILRTIRLSQHAIGAILGLYAVLVIFGYLGWFNVLFFFEMVESAAQFLLGWDLSPYLGNPTVRRASVIVPLILFEAFKTVGLTIAYVDARVRREGLDLHQALAAHTARYRARATAPIPEPTGVEILA